MESSAQEHAVEAAALEKAYGRNRVLRGVSFAVARGAVFSILGPNGAGKTTAMEILEGLRRPDSGEVRVMGLDPVQDASTLRPRLGIMPQEGGLYPGLKVEESLRLFAAFYPSPLPHEDLIASLDLEDHRKKPARRLSGGLKQRLSLALALVGNPEVAFLDEPTAGMDVIARADTWALIRGFAERGSTVVIATNSLDEAEELSDTVAIIDRGEVVALGDPKAMTNERRTIEIRTNRPIDVAAVESAIGAKIEEVGDAHYLIEAEATPQLIASVTESLVHSNTLLQELLVGRKSLQAVFLSLIAER